jgi:hypothetical protein
MKNPFHVNPALQPIAALNILLIVRVDSDNRFASFFTNLARKVNLFFRKHNMIIAIIVFCEKLNFSAYPDNHRASIAICRFTLEP